MLTRPGHETRVSIELSPGYSQGGYTEDQNSTHRSNTRPAFGFKEAVRVVAAAKFRRRNFKVLRFVSFNWRRLSCYSGCPLNPDDRELRSLEPINQAGPFRRHA